VNSDPPGRKEGCTRMPTEWWESFFSGVALDLWRQAVKEEQTRAEAGFIHEILQVPPPARLLDVPCGYGRISFELASRGYQMTGVDIARPFLEEARDDAAAHGLSIAYQYGDIRSLPWTAEFDGAICWGNSFGYFEDAGNRAFLNSVAEALRTGGRFILDASSVAELAFLRFREREWAPVGNILFLEENQYDHVSGRMITHYTFIRDGKVEAKTGSHRIYTYREMCGMMEEAGFANVRSYGSLSKEGFHLGSHQLFLAATKGS
jgi:SAM-dependent methyltransferase